jgi:hypothetical protein
MQDPCPIRKVDLEPSSYGPKLMTSLVLRKFLRKQAGRAERWFEGNDPGDFYKKLGYFDIGRE